MPTPHRFAAAVADAGPAALKAPDTQAANALDALLRPASVAVFGASDRPHAVGAVVWQNVRRAGFAGRRVAINPRIRQIDGEPVHPSLAAAGPAPDLAVVCTPPASVVAILEDFAERGGKAAIVVTAGLDAAQRQALRAVRDRTGLRILGPNCIGAIAPAYGLNASFAHTTAQPGPLAFVTQSGALMTAMLDWASSRRLGFSCFISLGDQLDVDCSDLLERLADDAATRAILLYVESVQDCARFLSAARAAARQKPVLLVKAGRSEQGSKAALSHTGALAGSDLVFDAAVRRAGMLRVDSVHDLFLAAETLACLPDCNHDALTVLTNGGGAGVLAADACAALGVPLADLPDEARSQLDALLPGNWSQGNPVDILGDAEVGRYTASMRALLAHPETGAVLFVHAPTAITGSRDIASALLPILDGAFNEPRRTLSCWLGDDAVHDARRLFRERGLPDYDTPEQAVRAFSFLRTFRRNQALLNAGPHEQDRSQPFDLMAIRAIVDAAIGEGRQWLLEDEAKRVLAAAGLPVVATECTAPDPAAAAAAAGRLGFPAALKIVSPELLHKSDLGGVALDLADAAAVRAAAAQMLAQLGSARPEARLTGFCVQRMAPTRDAIELILGAHIDAAFGPVVLFGHGGTAVEVWKDRAVALPPLDLALAGALIDRTQVSRLLAGYRNRPPADRDAVCRALVAVCRLLADVPEIAELDANPLLARPDGALVLDARIRLDPTRPGGAERFALRRLRKGE